jgi:hypothetical protein
VTESKKKEEEEEAGDDNDDHHHHCYYGFVVENNTCLVHRILCGINSNIPIETFHRRRSFFQNHLHSRRCWY